MEFSFDRSAELPPKNRSEGSDTNSIANERLKKAIEKNRAKQAAKQEIRPETRYEPRPELKTPAPNPHRVETPDFVPVKRTVRKMSNQVDYPLPHKKKMKPLNPRLVSLLVKACWVLCGLMFLRLIFANGGVTDFYSQNTILSERLKELDQIKNENMQLVNEIEKMQKDISFQKKLVRDNLGFIAPDEFLVLFQKEKLN